MLDDNLPTFFLRAPSSENKLRRDIYLSYRGADPAPAYALQYWDSSVQTTPAQKNCYAAGLFDAYNPEVLFAEVLVRPEWTHPTLSQEEIRRNGGIPPPPQPLVPSSFWLQLYNPEQQVHVEVKEGKWGASDSYEFSLPINTFRTPSASRLDQGQSDPTNLPSTPKVHFVWRRESKLSKELTCYMTGKSTDVQDGKKKRSRNDPDIAVGLWRSLRELTVYEPNLSRVDVEDPKGLELVLLLSAIIIKDLYLGNKDSVHGIFNISPLHVERRPSNDNHRSSNSPALAESMGRNQGTSSPHTASNIPRPPVDPRVQWEIDAETARLKAQVQAEQRATRLAHERKLKAKEKEDEAERKRLLKIVEDEQREERRRQAEVERETERLRRLYGPQPLPPQRPTLAVPVGGPHPHPPLPYRHNDPAYMSGANPASSSSPNLLRPQKKKSFFGLRSISDEPDNGRQVVRKGSAMW